MSDSRSTGKYIDGDNTAGSQMPVCFDFDTPISNDGLHRVGALTHVDVSSINPIAHAALPTADERVDQTKEIDEDGFPPGRTLIAIVEKVFYPSWFLELPEEARKKIYSYYFFPQGQDCAPSPHFSKHSSWRIKPPALLQTCRDIRREALPIYYDEFYVSTRHTKYLIPWLKSLDFKARLALGIVNFRWDWAEQKRKTVDEQADKYWAQLKAAGVEVRRNVIEM